MQLLDGAPEGARCAHHPDEAAGRLCQRCGDFLCGRCAQVRGDGTFCARCAPTPIIRSEPGPRVLAHIVDNVLLYLPPMALVFVLVAAGVSPDDSLPPLLLGGTVLFVAVTIWQGLWIHQTGQSVGKRLLKIRVARRDGSLPGVARVFILRNALPALISQIPLIGILYSIANLVMLFGEERRCVHDYIADTVVLDMPERHPYL